MKRVTGVFGGFGIAALLVASVVVRMATAAPADEFVTTWNTANAGTTNGTSIGIPLAPSTVYNFQIDWNNDGVFDQTYSATTPASPATYVTHDYLTAGTYTIRIKGTFPRIYFNNGGDKLKITQVNQWGTAAWTNMNGAFYGCANLRVPATDAPNLTIANDLSQIFMGASSLNDPLNNWNVSTITSLQNAFSGATAFNQPLNNWNVSNVSNMINLFTGAVAFNQDLTSWNTSSATSMSAMFNGATVFNNGQAPGASTAPLTWNTSKVTSLQNMFLNANAFNQPINTWDTSKVTNLYGTFQSATQFNQPLSNWNTALVSSMSYTFFGATKFNQPLDSWNVANVTSMLGTFQSATAFNQPLNSWNTSKVTTMLNMFMNAPAFNNGLASGVSGSLAWNTGAVTTMQNMFLNAAAFNQIIGTWNTALVNNTSSMFSGATVFNNGLAAGASGTLPWNTALVTTMKNMFTSDTAFNQDVGSWNTGNVTSMAYMFSGDNKFNQAIGAWNTSKVNDMQYMFQGASVFNNGLAAGVSGPMNWDTSLVTTMAYMFDSATVFNQNISTWNVGNVIDMTRMLSYLNYFNQPIGTWSFGKPVSVSNMLRNDPVFDQPLGSWNATNITNATNFLASSKLSIVNYDNLLIGWNAQAVKPAVVFHGGTSQYCSGAAARANLITVKTWTFSADGGQNCAPSDIGLTATSIPENTTAVGTLSSVDPDVGNTFTYSLVSGAGSEDNAKFTINSVTKALSFVTAPNFESPTDLGDTAANNTYSIRIRTTDNLGGTFEKVFIISVTNVDEEPPVITITAPTKLKNGTITNTTISVTDATGVNATDVTIAPVGSTAGTSGLVCTQTTSKQVDCTINITSSGDLNIQAKDTLSNTGTKKELNYVVDTTLPVFSSGSVDVITNGINKPILTFSATDNIAVDHYEIIYVADNGGAGVNGSTTTMNPATSPVTLTLDPDEAVHTVTIRVYDTAGNYSDRVIKFPPIVNFTAPTTLSKTTITNSTVTITSPGGNDLTGITLNAGTTGASLGTCTGAGNDTTDPYANPVTCVIQNVASTGTVTVNAKDSVTGAVGQNSQSYIIDTTAPTITITAPTKLKNANITNTAITVTDNVAILAANVTVDSGTTAGTSNFSCTQTTATQVDCTVTITSSGDLKIAVADKAANSITKTETNYVIDTTSPVVTVASLATINASTQAAYDITGTCTNGDGPVSVVVNGNSLSATCSSGSWTLTVDLSGLSDGTNVLTVTASQTDTAGNTTTTAAQHASKDTVAPSIALSPLVTNSTSPSFSGTVDDPTAVITVTVNGITYTATNNGDGTWSLPAGTITPALTEGTYDIIVTATDTAGNSSTDSTTNELTIDTTKPTATVNQKVGQADPTNVDSATFTIQFSEAIKDGSLTAADLTVSGTIGTVSTLTKIAPDHYEAVVTGMASGDTVSLTLPAGAAQDPAGNTNTASTSTDNSVTYDAAAPTVTVNQAISQADPTNVNSATYTIVFSEPVNGLTASDFSLSATSGTVASLTTTDNQTYIAVVTGMTNGDTAVLTLPAGAATDAAGNTNNASTSTDNKITYDTTPATITITAPTKTKNTSITDTTLTITDAVGITAANVSATGGTLTCTQVNPTKVTCTVVVTASGSLVITAIDNAGNTAIATEPGYVIDTNAPTATFTYSTAAPTNQPVTITMTTDKPIATPSGWTKVSDTVYTKTVSANTTSSDNTVTITDLAGNNNTIPFSVTNIDATAPQGTVTSLATTSTSPALGGSIDADATSVDVTINGNTYHAVISNGTWSLPAGTITPALIVGNYTIDVIATDAAGNTSTKTAANALTILSDTAPLTNNSPNQGTDPAVNNATMAVMGGTCQSGFYGYKSLSPAGVTAPQSNVTIIGGVTYKLSCGVLGGDTTVDVSLGTYYNNLSLLRIYKQIDGKLVDVTSQVNLRNSGGKTLFTVNLTDGATNDEDKQTNKEILDPLYIGIIDPKATLVNTGESVTTVLFVAIAMVGGSVHMMRRRNAHDTIAAFRSN